MGKISSGYVCSSYNGTIDRRYMAAAIRLARHHIGLTGTNPSVACILVRIFNGLSRIVGIGVTDLGGRPHAEIIALEEAGEQASGATAYITLEPCAHHGMTPPCAGELASAGIARVVTAYIDPDNRVNGKGHAMLRDAGIEVIEECLAHEARELMAGYLSLKSVNRPRVLLKLAVSEDGFLGVRDSGPSAITGEIVRSQVHLMRAASDAILVGVGTIAEDNPLLTCRLPGMTSRNPLRFVLDPHARTNVNCALVRSALQTPVFIVCSPDAPVSRQESLRKHGCQTIFVRTHQDKIVLPELLSNMAERNIGTLMVEGGAKIAQSFLDSGLVDDIALFVGKKKISGQTNRTMLVHAPITTDTIPKNYVKTGIWKFGDAHLLKYNKLT